jgi:branched-chain amino acid transport system substrate-binding protein
VRLTRTRFTVFALLMTLALLAAACGGRLSDAEILKASGSPVTSSVARAGGNTRAADGANAGAVGTTDSGGSVTAGQGSTGSTTGGAPSAVSGGSAPGGGATVGTPGETGPIVIGSVGNYSGPAGAAQAGIPRGVQAWAAEVNSKGGLFGRQVQVIVQDDGGDPARYASDVRDLVENRGVVAFVGNGASLSMRGGTPYLQQKRIPVIGSDCSVPDWFTSPVYFPQCPDFTAAIGGIMRVGHELSGKTRFGFLVCSEAASCTTQKPLIIKAAPSTGVQLVYEADISLTQVDFTAECRNAQAAKVDLFYVGADPATLARVARSCDRQGFHPQYVQASISVANDTKDLQGIGDLIVASAVFAFEGGTSPGAREFNQVYDSFVGRPPDPSDAQGWAAAKLFERIAINAATARRSISSATLLEAAGKLHGENLGGLVTDLDFTQGHANNRNCYFAVQARNDKWVDAFNGRRCV